MPVAFITGGASLICDGAARKLSERGWTIVVTDIDLPGAHRIAGLCKGPGRAVAMHLDATDSAQVGEVVRTVLRDHGRIDGLLNGAGGARGIGFPRKPFVEMDRDYWTRMLDANLNSMLNVTHAVLPAMIGQKAGSIVSIAAGRGLKGGRDASIYSAAKAAIIVFAQSVAQEVGQFGVRINTIAPGNAEARWKKPSDQVRSPLGRNTNADDVGKAVSFLFSDEACHITGSCLDISGGTSLH
jgi:NAD(P)-dependent dehydrogenase (short-subunit alcohol dehydrogenase family)